MPPQGYLCRGYVESLAEWGRPRALPLSGGWVLERKVPGTEYRDAMGAYPLFCAWAWDRIKNDLDEIDDLVSLVLVPDPFAPEVYSDAFDFVKPYKEHYVVDMTCARPSKHHRYYARQAVKEGVNVRACEHPILYLNEWGMLYSELIKRYGLTGLYAFSDKAFAVQLSLPGLHFLLAEAQGEVVAGHIWYEQNGVAYSHLGASSEIGYELNASYALYSFALEYFRTKVRWLDLGGAPDKEGDGLAFFKRGWATGRKQAYLCGKVFRPDVYKTLSRGHGTKFFPSYRSKI